MGRAGMWDPACSLLQATSQVSHDQFNISRSGQLPDLGLKLAALDPWLGPAKDFLGGPSKDYR